MPRKQFPRRDNIRAEDRSKGRGWPVRELEPKRFAVRERRTAIPNGVFLTKEF